MAIIAIHEMWIGEIFYDPLNIWENQSLVKHVLESFDVNVSNYF